MAEKGEQAISTPPPLHPSLVAAPTRAGRCWRLVVAAAAPCRRIRYGRSRLGGERRLRLKAAAEIPNATLAVYPLQMDEKTALLAEIVYLQNKVEQLMKQNLELLLEKKELANENSSLLAELTQLHQKVVAMAEEKLAGAATVAAVIAQRMNTPN